MKEIRFIDYCNMIKVSNKCKVFEGQQLDDGHWIIAMTGSANDILKGIKSAEMLGYYSTFTAYPILRTGRRYELVIDDTSGYWTVWRVNRAV